MLLVQRDEDRRHLDCLFPGCRPKNGVAADRLGNEVALYAIAFRRLLAAARAQFASSAQQPADSRLCSIQVRENVHRGLCHTRF